MMDINKLNYPLKSEFIRKAVVNSYETCPECGGCLDTGCECNDCGYDAMHLLRIDTLNNDGDK